MNNLPTSHIVSIGKASEILGVSIDTLRRWDKAGKISSIRPDGKDRYFDISELEKIKSSKVLSISQASEKLGVSASTLRRYEQRGFLTPKRNEQGERVYDEDLILNFSLPKVSAPEAPSPVKLVKAPKNVPYNVSWQYPPVFIIVLLLITTIFSTLYIQDKYRDNKAKITASTAKVLGAKDQGGIIGFFAGIGQKFSDTNKKVLNQYKTALNIIQRTIVVKETERIVVDQSALKEIDAKFVQGKKPGENNGDLVVFSSGGLIPGLRVSSANLLSGSVTVEDLANDAVISSKILNDSIKNEDIANSAINSGKIEDDTVTANDLYSAIYLSDGDLIDFSGITHSSTSKMGLILPNVSSASPSSPSSGEGYLAYDTAGNQVLVFDGASWTGIGGSVTLATGGGLTYFNDELTLSRSCDSGQLLKWNGSSWACGNDTGGAGSGMATVEKSNVNVVTSALSLDFSSDFGITLDTGEGENEADVAIDYTTSKITRTDQTQSISGGWTFSNLTVSDTDISLSGASSALSAAAALTLTSGGTSDLTLNAGSGAVKIAAGDSIGNATWSISSTGAGTSLTANDLDCTNCIGATEINESGISSTNLSDGANIAHINAAETVTGGWTFNTASTTFTTSVLTNGGITTSAATALSVDSGTTGAINIGTSANAKTITVGNTTTSTSVVLTKGGSGNITLTGFNCSTYTNGGVLTTDSSGNITCANDDGGAGGSGIATVEEANVDVVSTAVSLDFTNDFNVSVDTAEGSNEADIAIDYTNSKITRTDQTQSISGGWTFSNLTVSDTNIDLSGGSTTFDMAAATDTVFTIANSSTGVGKLKIDSLTNGGAGCNTIDTTADGTLICGTDEGGGGGGIAIIEENDVSVVTSAASIDFLGTDFVVGAVGTEGNISIDYTNSKILRSDQNETITGSWSFATGEIAGGGTPLRFEGATSDNIYTQFAFTDPTTSTKTITFPNATITVNAAADISGTTLASNVTGSSLTSVGTLTSLTVSGALAANGGITFDAATDTVGAHTLSGTIDASTNIITNIGNSGTDFVATTGALTLAGVLTANGGVTIADGQSLSASGNTTLGNAATDQVTVTGEVLGASPLSFEGTTDNNIYTIFAITDPTVSSKTITFPNATITVNAAADISGTTLASNVTGSSLTSVGTLTSLTVSGALAANGGITFDAATDTVGAHTLSGTIDANTNILTNIGNTGTDFVGTTGALTLAGVLTANGGVTIADGQGLTANGNITLGNAAADQVTVTGEVLGASPLSFEGTTDNNIYTIFSFTDPTVSNKTITFPNASITVNAAGDLSGTTLASGVTGSSLTSVGTLSSLTVTGAISGATATNTINGMVISSGAVSSVTTLGMSSTLTVGSGGNTFTFNPASGPVYAGTARPSNRITLTPEYAGASLTGDGSSNVGIMTSDNDKTASSYRNYYNWTTSQGTSQDYDIWLKIPLPADFDAMAATPTLSVETYSSDLTNGTVLVTVYDTGNTADCTDASFTPTGAINTWETKTQTSCLDTGTYVANGIITVKINLKAAASGGITRVGSIYFDYKAKF